MHRPACAERELVLRPVSPVDPCLALPFLDPILASGTTQRKKMGAPAGPTQRGVVSDRDALLALSSVVAQPLPKLRLFITTNHRTQFVGLVDKGNTVKAAISARARGPEFAPCRCCVSSFKEEDWGDIDSSRHHAPPGTLTQQHKESFPYLSLDFTKLYLLSNDDR